MWWDFIFRYQAYTLRKGQLVRYLQLDKGLLLLFSGQMWPDVLDWKVCDGWREYNVKKQNKKNGYIITFSVWLKKYGKKSLN